MNTLFVGQHKIVLEQVDSTNSYARELLKEVNQIEGTVIITHNQTAGRGQQGTVWRSEPFVNLTFSLILYPKFLNPQNHFYLSKMSAIAITECLAAIFNSGNYDINIKWPNDILVNNKKIAGILIENSFRDQHQLYSIIGIGVNINQKNFGTLSAKACSFMSLTGIEKNINEVFTILCEKLEKNYLQLKSGKFEEMDQKYLKGLLGYKSILTFSTPEETFAAKIEAVLEDGQLLLDLENGEKRRYYLKEISFHY